MKLRSVITLAGLLATIPAIAQQRAIYFTIGGAEPISKPAWTSYNVVPLYAAGDLSWNFSCGKFSVQNSVNQLLRDVRSGADEYLNAMVANAQAAIASLPAILLQRANPTLYDVMQNGLLRVQAMANAARLDCKSLEESIIANGGGAASVWDNFKQAARLSDWSVQASFSRDNVVAAQRNVEENGGRNGVSWPASNGGSRAGGDGQPPIKLSADIMLTGYKMAVRQGSPSVSGTNPERAEDATSRSGLFALYNFFPTERSASEYITRVVGETTVTTNANGEKTTVPGFGLREEVSKEATRVAQLLATAIASSRAMSAEDRRRISPSGVQVTDQLIRSLREMPADEQRLLLVRLANEIAIANEIDRALMAIAAYRLGTAHPSVAGNATATAYSEDVIVKIKEYIDDLLFETRVRREMVAETALHVLDRAYLQRTSAPLPIERSDKTEPELGTNPKD